MMQLPNSVKDDASRALWKAEMLRFAKTVEERFGHEISEDALRDAIVLKTANVAHWPTFIIWGS